jgi:hypothetical protein
MGLCLKDFATERQIKVNSGSKQLPYSVILSAKSPAAMMPLNCRMIV